MKASVPSPTAVLVELFLPPSMLLRSPQATVEFHPVAHAEKRKSTKAQPPEMQANLSHFESPSYPAILNHLEQANRIKLV